jgi:hypothetical protein
MILDAGAGGVLESEIGLAAQSDNDTLPTSIATVSVPAGAFTQQVDLLASGRLSSEMPPVQAGLRPTELFLEVTAVADGQEIHQFANGRRLQLTIQYTQEDLNGVDPSKLVLYYWDEARRTWSFQGLSTTAEPANQRIVVRLEHLSRMGTMGADLRTGWLPLIMR